MGLGADDYLTKLYQLEGLLDDSFLCTRLLGASLPMKCASVAALPPLWEALAEFYPQFETAGAAPELQFSREDMTVRGNAEVLGWVYRNLIANALRHGGGGLTVNAGDGAVNFSPWAPALCLTRSICSTASAKAAPPGDKAGPVWACLL